jgi:plasmid stabilization system protein ParE
LGFEPLGIFFSHAARTDLNRARKWYGDKSPLLGEAFSDRIQEAVERIAHQPLGAREFHRGIRRVVIRQFPFLLFYRAEQHRVVVVGCRHEREDPDDWPDA